VGTAKLNHPLGVILFAPGALASCCLFVDAIREQAIIADSSFDCEFQLKIIE
jgi:hypothetical protein